MQLNQLSEKLKRDFLAAIAEDTKLDKQGFLNRVLSSIETNGVEFTAEIYDLTVELVTALSDASNER